MHLPIWLFVVLPILGLVLFTCCFLCFKVFMWVMRGIFGAGPRPPVPPAPPRPPMPLRLAPVAARQPVTPVRCARRGSSGGGLLFAIVVACGVIFVLGNYRNERTRARAVREQAQARVEAKRRQAHENRQKAQAVQNALAKLNDDDENVEFQILTSNAPDRKVWVEGYGETQEDAWEMAADKAHDKVLGALQRELPGLQWLPSPEYVTKHLVKETYKSSVERPELGTVRQVRFRVEVTPSDKNDILQRDRHYRMEQRMLLLAKVLGGLVAVLATIAMYVRLDEFSKGYYTLWLRVAGVVAAAVTAGLVFFAA